jgi:demethylmenaquinone methyltransferase / 2-methoxy-6-polyprenyl-1,4-benzoquinol methylase
MRRAFYAYFYGMVPLIGRVIGGDAAAYRYLPQSLVNFPDADQLAALFGANGFAAVRYIPFMGGVATLHVGMKAKAPILSPVRAPEAVAP